MRNGLLTVITLLVSFLTMGQPYKNPQLLVEQRVNDLLMRMKPDEKFWQLFMIPGDLTIGKEKLKNGIFGLEVDARGENKDAAGQMLVYDGSVVASQYASKINDIQHFFVNETRLGIPVIPFAESLHGLGMAGCTSFPQSIALAATWDTKLMHQVAQAIAMETRSRGLRQVLDPVINIAHDVRWGRVEETYGEDPYLTSQMGLAYMQEFEKLGVITTPKHFAVNSGDGGRDSYPIHYNERLLEEIYFPAFKTGFQQAGARSVMSAYNSLDGSPCTSNVWLLNRKLKEEWKFRGFVISDACAVGGANVLHFTAADYAEATKNSLESGLDVIFQTDHDHYSLFKEAFDKGMIAQPVIDSAVARVLCAKFQLGLFENPYVDIAEADKWNGIPFHRETALQAARESIVLLKNEDQTLPLRRNGIKIAVIGTDAVEARLGGYSGPGINKISILDGIKKLTGYKSEIKYTPGCGRTLATYTTIPSGNLYCVHDGQKVNGLIGEYFDNISLSGKPAFIRADPQVNFGWTLYSPGPELAYDWYSVRWTGKLHASETGRYSIGIEGNDGYRLYIDNKLVLDDWNKMTYRNLLAVCNFEKGKEYDIKIEFFESSGNARIRLVWTMGVEDHSSEEIVEAVKLASSSDVAIVVAGINEGEFNDRAHLSLPGRQEEMIRAVAATGKPMVVLLIGGSAITMSNWMDRAQAILDGWYPGEAGGEAIAEVLFGEYNPSGRLPVTFPVFEGQLPLVYNHKPTGRGDDYTDLTGQPLFPFGYGLSYTTFEYSNLAFDKQVIHANETSLVSFKVKNTGTLAGDEVVQLYMHDELASVARPVTELKGFQRIHLNPGETKELHFELQPVMFSMLNKDLKEVIEPGDFRVMIGASCKDIRLRGIFKVVE
jgi:beta-glucosidase